jgi:hypothetical protein
MDAELLKQLKEDIQAVGILAGMSETAEFVSLEKSFAKLMASIVEGCHD